MNELKNILLDHYIGYTEATSNNKRVNNVIRLRFLLQTYYEPNSL